MSKLDRGLVVQSMFPELFVEEKLLPFFPRNELGKNFFELYGIGEAASVYCRRGMVSIDEMMSSDQVISREKGFVRPLRIFRSPIALTDKASAKQVEKNFFGKTTPCNDLVIGSAVNLEVPIQRKDKSRPKLTIFDMESCGHYFASNTPASSQLYVPVFKEAVSILVQGVYVKCPGQKDLAKFNETRPSTPTPRHYPVH